MKKTDQTKAMITYMLLCAVATETKSKHLCTSLGRAVAGVAWACVRLSKPVFRILINKQLLTYEN